MSLGRLAAVDIDVGTNTLIYTVPIRSGEFSATLNICNRNDIDVVIRYALVDGDLSDLVNEDWTEYDVLIRAGGGIERSGLKITPGQSIIGYSNIGNVNFQVWA